MYLKMKKIEYLNCQTKFLYWIEDSLLSHFRWQIFDRVTKNARSYDEIVECLSNPVILDEDVYDVYGNEYIRKEK